MLSLKKWKGNQTTKLYLEENLKDLLGACFVSNTHTHTHAHIYMYFKPAPGSPTAIQSPIVLDPAYKYGQRKLRAGNS